MSLALRAGLFVYELVGEDGRTVRRCLASSLRLAYAALSPGKGQVVASAASRALGVPKPLAEGMCKSCGIRPAVPAYGHASGRCAVCQPRVHVEQQERVRSRDNPYPERTYAVRFGKRKAPAIESVSPALMAEMRAELEERLRLATVPGKAGRPRTRGITTEPRRRA